MSSTASEIEGKLSDYDSALPDDVFSQLEKVSIWFLVALVSVLSFGLIFANDIFWGDGLKPIVWDHIVKDAGDAGDAGY